MRSVISEPSDNPRRDDLSRFDDHLRYISTALFSVGMLVVFLVANFNLVRPQAMYQLALNSLVAVAGASVVGILLFPWHRYHRNLFLVTVTACA